MAAASKIQHVEPIEEMQTLKVLVESPQQDAIGERQERGNANRRQGSAWHGLRVQEVSETLLQLLCRPTEH